MIGIILLTYYLCQVRSVRDMAMLVEARRKVLVKFKNEPLTVLLPVGVVISDVSRV